MITGAHVLLYSTDADADRVFLRDILQFKAVDAGGGWLIFALPPAEVAVHPTDESFVKTHADEDLLGAVLYLMCDDVGAMVQTLEAKNVVCSPLVQAPWGIRTSFRLPSGGEIGLYQPQHPTAI